MAEWVLNDVWPDGYRIRTYYKGSWREAYESELKKIEKITIDEGITRPAMMYSICQNMINLREVEFPKGEFGIYYNFFKNTGFECIAIPNSVTSIGWGAFANCRNLREISFPENAVHIAEAICQSNYNLKTVNFGKNVKHIHERAFYGCGKLNIVLPESIEIISVQSLFGIGNSELVIPKSCKKIYAEGCGYMKNLTHLIIKNPKTESWFAEAFKGCTNLKTVTIGDKTFDVKMSSEYPMLVLGEPMDVHGISVQEMQVICGEKKFVATIGEHIAWGKDKEEAASRARAKLMRVEHRGKVINARGAAPNARFTMDVTLQELYSIEAATRMWNRDGQKCPTQVTDFLIPDPPFLFIDCEKCSAQHADIYNECMNRYGLKVK